MSLVEKIEQVLKDELKYDNIKIIIEMIEFLKFKESQRKWDEINESEHEYITEKERAHIEEVKVKGEFIDQEELLKKLGISENEICN